MVRGGQVKQIFGMHIAPKVVVGGIILALVASVARAANWLNFGGFDLSLLTLVPALLLTGAGGLDSIRTTERVSRTGGAVALSVILLLEVSMWNSGTLLLALFMVPILFAFGYMMADRMNKRTRRGFVLMGIGVLVLLLPALISPWLLYASFFPAAIVELVGLAFLFAIGAPVPPKPKKGPSA